jgi:hypothetical protein
VEPNLSDFRPPSRAMRETALKTFRVGGQSHELPSSPSKSPPASPQKSTHHSHATAKITHLLKKTSMSLKRSRDRKGKGKETSDEEGDDEIEEVDSSGRPIKRVRGGETVPPEDVREVIVIDEDNEEERINVITNKGGRPQSKLKPPVLSGFWEKQKAEETMRQKELNVFRVNVKKLR